MRPITVAKAAKMLGVSRERVYQLVRLKKLKPLDIERPLIFSQKEIDSRIKEGRGERKTTELP